MFFFSPLIHYPCTVWMGVACGLFSESRKLIIMLCLIRVLIQSPDSLPMHCLDGSELWFILSIPEIILLCLINLLAR